MENLFSIIWIIILLQLFIPFMQARLRGIRRLQFIRNIEKSRKSRFITLIHRQETMSFLGFPIARYIDIEDSEQVLRAIRMTPPEMPIDLLLHTPGGLVLAAEQIACALKRHKGKVTVFIPHYAMSGGMLVALATDEIVMDPDAVLSPVDPQLGTAQGSFYPAASILEALNHPNPNRDDQTLILGDIAKKAMKQVHETVFSLVKDKLPLKQARELAKALSDGRWTHDYPIGFDHAKKMGLPVSDKMPREIYMLMELYPQPSARRPSVEYVPIPYEPQPPPPRRKGR